MSNSELQNEEREVLQSIYDGDQQFKEVSSNTFQYKVKPTLFSLIELINTRNIFSMVKMKL